jgi:NAD(P)-dependent dehydrogenase (short-subunit alcohol dehydrogenase family)
MILRKRGASIVNVSPVLAPLYPGGLSDFSASKAGLSALHHCLEAEYRYYVYDARIKFFLVELAQMETPLFNWIDTPSTAIAPVLRPSYAAEKTVDSVESDHGRVTRLPGYASCMCIYDLLPAIVQRWTRYLLGFGHALAVHKLITGYHE